MARRGRRNTDDDSHDGARLLLVPREHSDATEWVWRSRSSCWRRHEMLPGGVRTRDGSGWFRRREAAQHGHVAVLLKTREEEAAREWVTSTPVGFLGGRDAESKALGKYG